MKQKKWEKRLQKVRALAMQMQQEPRLPAAIEAALQERARVEGLYKSNPGQATKARFQRAHDAVIKAQIASSRPVAVGDGLVSFLRHGRP